MSNLHRPAADASGLPEKAEKVIQKDLSFASMSVTVMDVGEDCLLQMCIRDRLDVCQTG